MYTQPVQQAYGWNTKLKHDIFYKLFFTGSGTAIRDTRVGRSSRTRWAGNSPSEDEWNSRTSTRKLCLDIPGRPKDAHVLQSERCDGTSDILVPRRGATMWGMSGWHATRLSYFSEISMHLFSFEGLVLNAVEPIQKKETVMPSFCLVYYLFQIIKLFILLSLIQTTILKNLQAQCNLEELPKIFVFHVFCHESKNVTPRLVCFSRISSIKWLGASHKGQI